MIPAEFTYNCLCLLITILIKRFHVLKRLFFCYSRCARYFRKKEANI